MQRIRIYEPIIVVLSFHKRQQTYQQLTNIVHVLGLHFIQYNTKQDLFVKNIIFINLSSHQIHQLHKIFFSFQFKVIFDFDTQKFKLNLSIYYQLSSECFQALTTTKENPQFYTAQKLIHQKPFFQVDQIQQGAIILISESHFFVLKNIFFRQFSRQISIRYTINSVSMHCCRFTPTKPCVPKMTKLRLCRSKCTSRPYFSPCSKPKFRIPQKFYLIN
eukprot:TRINITY_DN40790_c0_g2_i1.p1 TRINITY_DN40790_c0_g2~~TRINITY_DN40790_c0_g2_i1.p1  ORF type:complete len:218 (-),score=-19.18 TRINITY_DN40790_c0_g2_i1:16-669(-)